MDYFISLGFGVLVVGVLFVIIKFFIQKENAIKAEMLAELTDEQIEDLKDNEVTNFDEKKNTWTQKAFIGRVLDKGNSYALKVLWYNTVIRDHSTFNDFQYADIKVRKAEFNEKGYKKGSNVKMFIDPAKTAKIL